MTGAEWTMLLGGTLFVSLLGAWHLAGILLVKKLHPARRSYLAVLSAFIGLLVLHISEIVLCAFAIMGAHEFSGVGTLRNFDGAFGDALFFAGINFATLGYTQVDTMGAIRLLIMLQALAGFMLITWSASFAYTIWNEKFRA